MELELHPYIRTKWRLLETEIEAQSFKSSQKRKRFVAIYLITFLLFEVEIF